MVAAVHVHLARVALSTVRFEVELARDTGELSRDTARLLLASFAEADGRLAKAQDEDG